MITDIDDIIGQCLEDSEEWFPDLAGNITFMALAAAGEVGEMCNLIKKVERGTHAPEEVADQVANEVVDAIIYLLNILGIQKKDFSSLYDKIRENNVNRFGNLPAAVDSGGR